MVDNVSYKRTLLHATIIDNLAVLASIHAMKSLKIGFAGMSHLGLVYGITMASRGHELYAFDPDDFLVDQLKKNRLPIFEPELDNLLAANKERIYFESSPDVLAKCDVVFVARDIATDSDNISDLTPLNELLEIVIKAVPVQIPVVILSQVHPGYSRQIAKQRSNVFYQVETLIFGRAVERALHPERYILGCANPSAPYPATYWKLLESYDCPLLKMRYESAELAKIAINLYLVSSVSTTNTLAEICENIGADWNEIAPSLRLDKRIGQQAYLTPGLGIAGGNLERDLITISKLAMTNGTDCGVVNSWIRNSSYRKNWASRILHRELFAKNNLKTPRIALWGLAYKQDTKSVKNSPAVHFAEGVCGISVQAYDPQVPNEDLPLERLGSSFKQVPSALDACDGADVLVILTPWKEFASKNPAEIAQRLKGKLVIDPFSLLNTDACRKAGLTHHCMGVWHE